VQLGRPVELFTFALPTASYYLTGHGEDVPYGGLTYVDTQVSRGNIVHVPIQQTREMIVTLPLNHALSQELLGNGISPRSAFVSIVRVHRSDTGIVYVGSTYERQIWSGFIQEAKTEGPWLRVRVPNYYDVTLDVKLPIARLTRTCQHVHYGPGCGLNRSDPLVELSYKLTATATGSGLSFNLSNYFNSLGFPGATPADQWLRHGEVVRRLDGERRSILDQVGNDIKIDLPFKTFVNGDAVDVWAGCDRIVTTCDIKFQNNHNFGGHTDVPISNPAGPTGRGLR